MYRHWTLARQFLLVSLLIVVLNGLIVGVWIGRQIERSVLDNASAITALYVNSIISPNLQTLATQRQLTAADVAVMDRLIHEPALQDQIVAFKIWTTDGQVVYSPNKQLIGRRFGIDQDLRAALGGAVATSISDLTDPENEFERQHWSHLQATYVPVRADRGAQVIAVTEFYQLPDRLDTAVAAARLRAWAIVACLTLTTYLLLAGIVGRGSRTIVAQQQALGEQVEQLSRLLDQNQRLHDRVRQAAGRTTALNEQALRRLSADLHDGPAQALALALLRIDGLEEQLPDSVEVAVVQRGIQEALREIRAISVGLRLPELENVSVREIVERIVRDHRQRSGTAVALEVGALPDRDPLPVVIALVRTLQEALSNATRHGGGRSVVVRVWQADDHLSLVVSDGGPGLVCTGERAPENHLGIEGMRERAQLLGGNFTLESQPGAGTTVRVCWPVQHGEDVWTLPQQATSVMMPSR